MRKNLSMAALATMICRLPKRESSLRLMNNLESTLMRHNHLITRIDFSYIVQSYSKMNAGSNEFYQTMAQTFKPLLAGCNSMDLVYILQAFSKSYQKDTELFKDIQHKLLNQNLNLKEIALSLNSFSKLNSRFEIFDTLENTILQSKSDLNAQQLSLILNAYSIQKPETMLFSALEPTILSMEHDRKSLPTIIYSYFKAGHTKSPIILSSTPDFVSYHIHELVNLYRVYVSYSNDFLPFLDIIEGQILARQLYLMPQSISNLIDFAAIHSDRKSFVKRLGDILDTSDDLLSECLENSHYCVMIIHGLTKYNTHLSIVSKILPHIINQLEPQESAIVMYSLKKCELEVPLDIYENVLRNLTKLGDKGGINLGYIMSKPQHYDSSFWKVFKPYYLSLIDSLELTYKASTQVSATLKNLNFFKELT